MKGVFRKLLLAACLIASMAIPVYANAPPSAEIGGTGNTVIAWLAFLPFLAFSMIVTCFSEWLVSLMFQLNHRNDRLIILTNVVSQILMWLAYILLHGYLKLDRALIIVILEILIYSGEFLLYWRKMHEVSWIKCLIYTVAANTTSLLVGALIL